MTRIPGEPRRVRLAASIFGAAFVAALGVSAPLAVDFSGLSVQQALAGKGGGNGGGRGGENGRGHGRDGMSASAAGAPAASDAAAGVRSNRPDRANDNANGPITAGGAESHAADSAAGTGATAGALGALNAAHASGSAFANASENSVVGKLSAYMDDMAAYLDALIDGGEAEQDAALQAAAGHLADAANKDELVDADLIHAVNTLLDGKADGFTHEGTAGDPVHESEAAVGDAVNPPPTE